MIRSHTLLDPMAMLDIPVTQDYQYGSDWPIAAQRGHSGQDFPAPTVQAELPGPSRLGMRTDPMWDLLTSLSTIEDDTTTLPLGGSLAAEPLARHPEEDEEEAAETEEEFDDDDDIDDDDEFDDDDDIDDDDDDDFDDDDDLDEDDDDDLDDLGDIDIDEDDDFDDDDDDDDEIDELDDDEEDV